MSSVARVLVVDDQHLFRSGLARLLNEDARVKVIGEAADGKEALSKVAELQPDVVLMDLRMPEMDGIAATREIAARFAGTKVIILTTFETETKVVEALDAGAAGYVLKDASPDAIAASITAVLAGERVMANAVAQRVVEMLTGVAHRQEFFDGLTPRQIEILKLVATGLANKQIASRLSITEKTVRNHVSNMYDKLQIYDRAQAVMYAVRKGLIEV